MNLEKLRRRLLILNMFVILLAAHAADAGDSPQSLNRAAHGIETLQGWYNNATGLYDTTGWWNSGNAITVLANYSIAARTNQYLPTFSNTFTAAQKTSAGFINNYYDDEGWWALAWIATYDLTHAPQYLAMAQSIFDDMARGWDTSTCGGGIWWSKDKTYKNAIANELFLSVAAHLANRTAEPQRTQYAHWARREWEWFSSSGMINSENLINDGLDSTNPKACVNNGKPTWSYNQGVILGGLAEYSRYAHDSSLLTRAGQIATAAITRLTDSRGILHDPCEPNCGADGPQFKGIFARNLMRLYASAPDYSYRVFADKNAESIWKSDQGSKYAFGLVWSGPFDAADASRQSSALDALIAAAVMHQERGMKPAN